MDIPDPNFLPNSSFTAPYILVGDDAFHLKSYLLKPYPGKLLQDNQNIFNYCLNRAHRCIENAFGILAARWQIFYSLISCEVETAQSIVKAAVVLHNYLQSTSSNVGDTSLSSGEAIDGYWRKSMPESVILLLVKI